MSFYTADADKQISEPFSPDDIPLMEGETSLLKEKTVKRKSPTKSRASKLKRTKPNMEYSSESDSGSDTSIDDYERGVLREMEKEIGIVHRPSNITPYEFSAMMENERFALERGLPILKPAPPPVINDRLFSSHPNSLEYNHKISRYFNSIQLLYNDAENCFYVEWEGPNLFASTQAMSYKRIYIVDYYFHIVGNILNGSSKSYIITGPSGIGKSQMILFIVAYLRTLPIEIRPAIYIKNNSIEYTLYIEDQVYVVEREENVRAVIEIIDSVSNYNKVLPLYGKRVELTNGNTSLSTLNESVVYCLPRWSKEDVIKCLKIVLTPPATPILSWNDSVNNVYGKIGGIVKYIILSTLNYDIDKEINDSIIICKKNSLPIYFHWNNSNSMSNGVTKYADSSGLLYEDLVDENYHLYGRSLFCDNTICSMKDPGAKDFYNLFRRFIKLSNWKEMLALIIGFKTLINNNSSSNGNNDNSLIKYEYHNIDEIFDTELPSWLIDTLTKDNIYPDVVFYSHYMVFTFKTEKKTYTMMFLYPEGIINIKCFTSYDLIYYPSSILDSVYTKIVQLKKGAQLIKYDYNKILNTFETIVTPFAVLDCKIAKIQSSMIRSLPPVEATSIKEEIQNNSNNIRNITVYLLSPELLKSTYRTMQTLMLVENSIYYNYFEIIISNFEWQQTLFNLCRIIYISPYIELKLILYYFLYKKGSAYLIASHCNNETGYIKTIYDVFGDAKQFVTSFNTKINSLRSVYPILPRALLIENSDSFY